MASSPSLGSKSVPAPPDTMVAPPEAAGDRGTGRILEVWGYFLARPGDHGAGELSWPQYLLLILLLEELLRLSINC